jgi:hypothetical protein
MNITPSFVFVHMPKTGGSFVSAMLRELHGDGRIHELLLRSESLLRAKNRLVKLFRGGRFGHEEFNKHGMCRDIPLQFAHLPILSCMRNPYDWYVSNYKYGWWRSHPHDYPDLAADPRWPNLSFVDYLELSHHKWLGVLNPGVVVNPSLGRLTVLFINYYCRQPDKIVSSLDDAELMAALRADMFPVHFLDTAQLNQQLYDYLLASGRYQPASLAFILERRKISPRNRRQPHESWPDFYDDALMAQIIQRDRFLFHLFPIYATAASTDSD